MSSRRGISDGSRRMPLGEAVEQVGAVVRARPGLGMVLHREGVGVGRLQPLAHAVVEVDVGHRGDPGEAVGGDGEVVVLAGDLDLPGRHVLHRVVGAVVAERQLDRRPAERRRQQLVAEADAEHRHRRAEQLGDDAAAPATQAGSPGPLDRKMPSGSRASTSAAGVVAGTTSTVPSRLRWRRIVRLMP